MRGKLARHLDSGGVHRIIPARAGQTASLMLAKVEGTDHPRACGANLPKEQNVATDPGSSPRVRGKLVEFGERAKLLRIIPARAGQTYDKTSPNRLHPDHPRACGANICAALA